MSKEHPRMNCEEAAAVGFDFEREAADLDESQRAAVEEHLRVCGSCAAQFETWRDVHGSLRALAEETRTAQTPLRVEMELRRMVMRLGHDRRWERRAPAIAACALVTVVVIAAMGLRHRVRQETPVAATPTVEAPAPPAPSGSGPGLREDAAKQNVAIGKQPADFAASARPSGRSTASASATGEDEFTLLPGAVPLATDDAAIVRVRLQFGALGALGLPVNEDRSGEWVMVDLLVSADGQPQAVRLAR